MLASRSRARRRARETTREIELAWNWHTCKGIARRPGQVLAAPFPPMLPSAAAHAGDRAFYKLEMIQNLLFRQYDTCDGVNGL
jgi:hypothetical protein